MATWKFHDNNSLIGQQKEFIQVFSHVRYLSIKEKDKLHYQTDTSCWCLLFCWIYGPMTSKAFNHQIKGPMSVIILVLISLWTQEYFINIRFFCMSLEMMGTYSLSDEVIENLVSWLVFQCVSFPFSQTICFVSFESTVKFVWSFIKNVHWVLSNSFYVRILWFSSFILLTWCITLIDLWILKHSCILGKNPLDSRVLSFSGIVEFSLL